MNSRYHFITEPQKKPSMWFVKSTIVTQAGHFCSAAAWNRLPIGPTGRRYKTIFNATHCILESKLCLPMRKPRYDLHYGFSFLVHNNV